MNAPVVAAATRSPRIAHARPSRTAALIPAGQIASMLAARIEGLVRELLPGGRREGQEWRCGSVAGEQGRSMGVHLSGGKAGVWSDFSTGEVGDALGVVAAILWRRDLADALRWSRAWLGLSDAGAPPQVQPAAIVAGREAIETCLLVAVACPDLRVLAAVSLGNLGAIVLPPNYGRGRRDAIPAIPQLALSANSWGGSRGVKPFLASGVADAISFPTRRAAEEYLLHVVDGVAGRACTEPYNPSEALAVENEDGPQTSQFSNLGEPNGPRPPT